MTSSRRSAREGQRRRFHIRLDHHASLRAFIQARRYDKLEYVREMLNTRRERDLLVAERGGRDVCWTEPEGDSRPLVTIGIPTYRRPELVERAVRSALAQTYEHIDVIVVGDATDDVTRRVMASISDERLQFINLRHPGIYPEAGRFRGMVSGSKPMNIAIDLAQGDWITNCDDDDELLPHHVESLLAAAKARRLEMVYGQCEVIDDPLPNVDGSVSRLVLGGEPLRNGSIVRGAALYSMGLRFMHYDTECWRIRDPHDWNLWKRMQLAGARIGFEPIVSYRYHRYRATER